MIPTILGASCCEVPDTPVAVTAGPNACVLFDEVGNAVAGGGEGTLPLLELLAFHPNQEVVLFTSNGRTVWLALLGAVIATLLHGVVFELLGTLVAFAGLADSLILALLTNASICALEPGLMANTIPF